MQKYLILFLSLTIAFYLTTSQAFAYSKYYLGSSLYIIGDPNVLSKNTDSNDDSDEKEIEKIFEEGLDDSLEEYLELEDIDTSSKATGFKTDGGAELKVEELEIEEINLEFNTDEKLEMKAKGLVDGEEKTLFEDDIDTDEIVDVISIFPMEGTQSSKVKISAENEMFELISGNTVATTIYPLTIETDSKAVVLETPSGDYKLNVLPDKAIEAILATKLTDGVTLTTIEIEEDKESEDKLVYKANGYVNLKLLGIIPLSIEVTDTVDAQSGQLISHEAPFYVQYGGFLFTK